MIEEKIDVDDLEDFDDVGGDEGGMVGTRRAGGTHHESLDGSSVSPTGTTSGLGGHVSSDTDRRMRRQIANCNERRRMQSINAGFQSLRALLPRKEGEKLSKAAILQQTAELIQSLRAERARLLEKDVKEESEADLGESPQSNSVWKKPRLDRERDSSLDSQPSSGSAGNTTAVSLDPSMLEQLRTALERERSLRVLYEHRLAQLSTSSSMTGSAPSSCPPSTPLSPDVFIQQQQHVQSAALGVIRPTPTQPLKVDVSLANLVTLSTTATPSLVSSAMNSPTSHVYIPSLASAVPQAASAFAITPVPPAPASMVSSPVPMVLGSTVGSIPQPGGFANRSLHAILEAIRHLEGNAAFASSSPPPQPATSHANLLVR